MIHKHSHVIVEKQLGIPPDYQYQAIRSKNFFQSSWHKNKLETLRRITDWKPTLRVLDLGAGSGNFELEFAKKVKEIIAVDYNDEASAFLAKTLRTNNIHNVKVITKDIREIHTVPHLGLFDVIILIDVIEHITIPDAQKLLKNLKSLLNPGGKLIVITPNYKSPWLLLEWILDHTTIVPKFHGEQHLAKFYYSNLKKMGEKSGLQSQKSVTFNFFSYLTPFSLLNSFLLQIELLIPFKIGNLIAAIYQSPMNYTQRIAKWQSLYANDQENLYKNTFVKTIFNQGHYYIANKLRNKKGTILDIGSGMGYHLSFENLKNKTYICLDSDKNMLDKIKKKEIKKVHASVEKIPLEKASVDFVIASHILEHIPNLEMALKEINRILHKNGTLLVVLPCDPGFLWNLLTQISPSRKRLKKEGLDYDEVMAHEHINSFYFCFQLLQKYFQLEDIHYFPLKIKTPHANLICGITFTKKIND